MFLLANNVGLTRTVDIVFVIYFVIGIDDRRRFLSGNDLKNGGNVWGQKKKLYERLSVPSSRPSVDPVSIDGRADSSRKSIQFVLGV